jgi:hypothetical protein
MVDKIVQETISTSNIKLPSYQHTEETQVGSNQKNESNSQIEKAVPLSYSKSNNIE